MKHPIKLGIAVLVAFFVASPAAAQELQARKTAFQELRSRGLTTGNGIHANTFFDQVVEGRLDEVKLFLTAGMDPNVTFRDRQAIFLAAENGHHLIVQALLEAGADTSVKDKVGRTPLVLAAMREHYDVVEVLLDAARNR